MNTDKFYAAQIAGTAHLYLPYARVTLCGMSKINKPSFYWYMHDLPFCAECCIRRVEMEREEKRDIQKARVA